jgi:predicted O-methyltransferase YrrM
MRDQGGGLVIETEIDPEKARHARNHFAEAGVADLIELREGDALVTLKDCGGPVDFLLVDGFPKLARTFVDYLDFVRRPANGFVSTLLPLRGGTELSVKT